MEINRNEQIAVQNTAPRVVSIEKNNGNVKRKVIVIQNTSTAGQIITISVQKPAVAGYGVVLAVGGTWQDAQDGQYTPTQAEITAISSAADGQIALYERCE